MYTVGVIGAAGPCQKLTKQNGMVSSSVKCRGEGGEVRAVVRTNIEANSGNQKLTAGNAVKCEGGVTLNNEIELFTT